MIQPEWFILQINEVGETATYPEIVAAVKSVFGQEVDYFIPIFYEQMGSYVSTNVLFEGYVFVKDSDEVRSNLQNLKDCRFFSGVLKICGKTRMLTSKDIGVLRRKLKSSLNKKYQTGTKVKICEGIFKNLEGEILSLDDDGRIATVRVLCLSREIIAPVPTTCVEELS